MVVQHVDARTRSVMVAFQIVLKLAEELHMILLREMDVSSVDVKVDRCTMPIPGSIHTTADASQVDITIEASTQIEIWLNV